jgi:hypothetical protein
VTGHPPGAFTTLARRAAADPAERDDLWRLIDGMPLDCAHVAVITSAAVLSARLLASAIDEVLDDRPAEGA